MINIKPITNLYDKKDKSSNLSSQILYGEKFKILLKGNKWIKIKTFYENYVGYIKNKNFLNNTKTTHKIFKLKSKIYIIKKKKISETKFFLSFGSKISILNENKVYIEFKKNRWIKKRDVIGINYYEKDFTKIFKLFLNTKYLWGGKTYKGIDCSALLQLFFYYNDIYYPRDTKDQIKFSKNNSLGKNFKKGDIIFWKGHVAICINRHKLIHAFGPRKKVIIMSIKKTISEIKKNSKLKVLKIYNINDF